MTNPPDATSLLLNPIPEPERRLDRLMEIVHPTLCKAAERLMRFERRGHTLQPTALVHEVYLRLVDQSRVDWKGKTHFYCVAVMAMRRFLKEYARNRACQKRGAEWQRLTLDDGLGLAAPEGIDVLQFEDALEELAEYDGPEAPSVRRRLVRHAVERPSPHTRFARVRP